MLYGLFLLRSSGFPFIASKHSNHRKKQAKKGLDSLFKSVGREKIAPAASLSFPAHDQSGCRVH